MRRDRSRILLGALASGVVAATAMTVLSSEDNPASVSSERGEARDGPPSFDGVFFVNMFDSPSQRYEIGRYRRRQPAPAGRVDHGTELKRACSGLAWPSVTRDPAGTYFMYAAGGEGACAGAGERRVTAVFSSSDGRRFVRRGTIRDTTTPYVVFDRGRFRAWWVSVPGRLEYAESSDGLRFRRRGTAKAPAIQIDYVFRDGPRWYLAYTKVVSEQEWVPALMTFEDPRKGPYRDLGAIATNRPVETSLAADAPVGAREIRVGDPSLFTKGDLIVIAAPAADSDTVQVETVGAHALTLSGALRLPHPKGQRVWLADARKVTPSYLCKTAAGEWYGIFTVHGAVPDALNEATVVYRAGSVRGRWTVDLRAEAPVFPLQNAGFRVSVENPTPITTSADVQRCG